MIQDEEEEKKHDVTEKEAEAKSYGQMPQVQPKISARQFYKRTERLSRAVTKQQEEEVSGKQSPDS